MNRIRKITLTGLLLLFALQPISAQERTDTVYTFRFVAGNDMFYVPWNGNDKELARLETCVGRLKERILTGEIPVRVDGYCTSLGSEEENLAMAKVRSNRVKSELITRQGLKEECFVTRNHATKGDSVTVTIKAPSNLPRKEEVNDRPHNDGEKEDTETPIYNKVENAEDNMAQDAAVETQRTETATQPAISTETAAVSGKEYTLSLRANLLRWATLTPDLGLEWRISRSWGILVSGSWTSWSWNDKDRRYALWEVSPEVRYYIGEEKRGYLGAMYKAGSFNYKLSTVGKQGDLMGGGITGGYQLRLNNALSIDFNVGIGCLHADYDKYTVIDGVRVRGGKESKNWWGPINAGVTLVWRMVK